MDKLLIFSLAKFENLINDGVSSFSISLSNELRKNLSFDLLEFELWEELSKILLSDKVLLLIGLLLPHFEISGNDNNDLHPKNKSLRSITLIKFQLDISGKAFKDIHSSNKPLISVTLDVSHFDISGKDINELHP